MTDRTKGIIIIRSYLLVDSSSLSENNVSTNQTSKERIRRSLLAAIRAFLEQKQRLIDSDEFAQVERVGLGRFED